MRPIPVTDLYFEAHITTDPVDTDRWDEFLGLVDTYDFRVADLWMHKGEEIQPWKMDAFCSGRGGHYDDLFGRMKAIIDRCTAMGIKVRRYKIENTLLDSRHPRENEQLLMEASN